MMKLFYPGLIWFFFCCVPQSVFAKEGIELTNINMPEVPAVSRTAAIYLTIHNHNKHEVTLTNVSTKVARHIMIHHSQEINGIAKMRHINELIIPAESKLEFQPGGYHIMLMGLDHKLILQPFNVTLEFINQPAKTFKVEKQTRNK